MSGRKSIYEHAVAYCGDPSSHMQRGELMLQFLQEEGLEPTHKVLDVGCGALSQGEPLLHFLEPGNYTGLDPNQWLIEAALLEKPWLLQRNPHFTDNSEFRASDGPYDYIIAHSVLSHAAHWQLEQALRNVRESSNEGAIWLASLRLDQYDVYARNWVYPGVSYFRIETVKAVGWHAGWLVEQKPSLRERLTQVCPHDFHDWVKLTAIPTPESMNTLRITEEEARREDREILAIAERLHARREDRRLQTLNDV